MFEMLGSVLGTLLSMPMQLLSIPMQLVSTVLSMLGMS